MPQNSKFRLPRGHRFRPKFDFFTVMAPYHGGELLGSILGPMGSHWVQKMGQNCKKLPCRKIRIFDYPAVIDFGQNWTLRLWRQITVGTPSVHHGANGVPLGTKMGQNCKKLPCPKIRIFDYPAVIDFGQNWTLRLWRQITVGTPSVHHGANGVPLGTKMCQNHKKLPCPKIRIFDYPAVIDFGQNLTLRLWRQITEGNPKCVHLGANGSHLVQKMGKNRKKLPCPKRRIIDYPAVIDFGQNFTLRLWRQITVGTP